MEKQYPKKSADPARPPHAVGDGTGWSTWRHAQPLACTASARAKSNATANTYAAWPAVVSCDVPTRRAPWMINRSASACSLRCKVRSHRTYRNQPISMDRPGDSICPRMRVRTNLKTRTTVQNHVYIIYMCLDLSLSILKIHIKTKSQNKYYFGTDGVISRCSLTHLQRENFLYFS